MNNRKQPEIDLADLASQRRESELDLEACEWSRLPEPLQPGQFPLEATLAVKVGLEAGTPVNADEFFELLMASKGLSETWRSRKRDVRDFIWKIVLKKPKAS